ncbi:MAG: 6-pyruvoyl-tetrahydropterin synthase-related protein [Candidatus Accumulibacter sp. UW26]|jgi:hypothetical protein
MSTTAAGNRGMWTAVAAGKQAAVLFALCVAVLLMICWFVVDPLKYGVLEELQSSRSLSEAARVALSPLLPRLVFLGLLLAVLCAFLARLEVRTGALSSLLTGDGTWAFVLVGLSLLLWFTQAYFYPGHFLGGDTGAHVTRVAHFGRGLAEGKNLFWNNYFYVGAPILQFYAPLFFWLGGGIFALTGEIDLSIKLLLLLLHLLSGVFFYGFMRVVGLRRFSALLGAISFAGAWAHTNLVLFKGALPLTVVIALCPAAFLLAERMMRSDRVAFGWNWAGLALVLAAMVAAHQLHGVYVGVYLAIYVLTRLWLDNRLVACLPRFAGALLAAAAMSLFAVLPFLLERQWVVTDAGASQLFGLRLPSPETLQRLLTWSNAATSMGEASAAYLGLSVVALAASGVFFLVHKAALPKAHKSWGVLMLVLFILSFFLTGSLLREVIYTLFFISALAALGCEGLLASRPAQPRLALLLLGLVLLDLGPTAVQPVARSDKYFLDEAGQLLAARSPNERVVIASTRHARGEDARIVLQTGPAGLPLNYYPVQTVSGPHNHTATLIHNYAVSALLWAERDLREAGRLSAGSAALLGIFNVSRIVSDDGRSMGLPASVAEAIDEGPQLGRTLRVAHPTPALFAPDLGLLPDQSALERPMLWREGLPSQPLPQAVALRRFLENFLHTLEPRLPLLAASRIPVYSLPDGHASRAVGARAETNSEPALVVVDHQVSADSVKLRLLVKAAGYLQISHAWYPTLAVFDNGQRVSTNRSAIGLIVVAVQPGLHDFRIQPQRSSLRRNLGALGLASLILTLAVPLLNRRRA